MGLTDKIAGLGGPALRNPFAVQVASLGGLSTQVGALNATVAPELTEPDISIVQNKIDSEFLPLKAQLQAKLGSASLALGTHGTAKASSMLSDLPLMQAAADARAYVAVADQLAAPALDAHSCGLDLAGAFDSFSAAALDAYDTSLATAGDAISGAVGGALDAAGVDALVSSLQAALAGVNAVEDQLQAKIAAEVEQVTAAFDYVRKLAFVRWVQGKADDPCIQYLVGLTTDGTLLG